MPIRRGLPFARARRHGLCSMSGRYSYGIDNPPTLRRSSFPQRVVRPVGVPKCKTRSEIPRDPTLVRRNLRFNRADPPLHCGQPSPLRCVLLSPQGLATLRGPHSPARNGYAVPKRGLNGAYRVSATHFYRLPRWSAEWRTTTPVPSSEEGDCGERLQTPFISQFDQ